MQIEVKYKRAREIVWMIETLEIPYWCNNEEINVVVNLHVKKKYPLDIVWCKLEEIKKCSCGNSVAEK